MVLYIPSGAGFPSNQQNLQPCLMMCCWGLFWDHQLALLLCRLDLFLSWAEVEVRPPMILMFILYTSRILNDLTKHKTRHLVKSYHPKTRVGDDVLVLFGDSCSRFPRLMKNVQLERFHLRIFLCVFLRHWKLKKKHPGSLQEAKQPTL